MTMISETKLWLTLSHRQRYLVMSGLAAIAVLGFVFWYIMSRRSGSFQSSGVDTLNPFVREAQHAVISLGCFVSIHWCLYAVLHDESPDYHHHRAITNWGQVSLNWSSVCSPITYMFLLRMMWILALLVIQFGWFEALSSMQHTICTFICFYPVSYISSKRS